MHTLEQTRAILRPTAAALQRILLQFYCFSALGWLWEVAVDLLRVGHFVNRGMLYGPWLPIYGVCGVLVVALLRPLQLSGSALLMSAGLLCGAAEYIASWLIETATGNRWWDYTGMPGAIHGRIFPLGVLLFGIAGWAGVRYLSPWLEARFEQLGPTPRRILCATLSAAFLLDLAVMFIQPNTAAMI